MKVPLLMKVPKILDPAINIFYIQGVPHLIYVEGFDDYVITEMINMLCNE